jgi:hypothetical protein
LPAPLASNDCTKALPADEGSGGDEVEEQATPASDATSAAD